MTNDQRPVPDFGINLYTVFAYARYINYNAILRYVN